MKGSQFIGTAAPVAGKDAAESFLENIRKEFYNATHNCYAYRIDEQIFRFSDDGEPGGTAGRPILSMLDKYQLRGTLLVVTRFFGGTKLGTGGLIRAYSRCADEAIRQAGIKKKANYQELHLAYYFDMINKVQHLVQKYGGSIAEDAT
ncbi:MAG: YigZ family protein, partial [Calditrichia bacterium]